MEVNYKREKEVRRVHSIETESFGKAIVEEVGKELWLYRRTEYYKSIKVAGWTEDEEGFTVRACRCCGVEHKRTVKAWECSDCKARGQYAVARRRHIAKSSELFGSRAMRFVNDLKESMDFSSKVIRKGRGKLTVEINLDILCESTGRRVYLSDYDKEFFSKMEEIAARHTLSLTPGRTIERKDGTSIVAYGIRDNNPFDRVFFWNLSYRKEEYL